MLIPSSATQHVVCIVAWYKRCNNRIAICNVCMCIYTHIFFFWLHHFEIILLLLISHLHIVWAKHIHVHVYAYTLRKHNCYVYTCVYNNRQTYNLNRQIHMCIGLPNLNALNSNVTTRLRLRRFAEVRSFACKLNLEANERTSANLRKKLHEVTLNFRARKFGNPMHNFGNYLTVHPIS